MARFNWILDESKFLTEEEVARLRKETKRRADKAMKSGAKTAVRDWLVIDLAMSTGLRAQEMSDLKCRDCFLKGDRSSLIVQNGKGGRSRLVKFSEDFKQHLQEYLEWKQQVDEPTSSESPLIWSTNTKDQMSKRGLQEIFNRCAERAGIKGHSIHHLRHTFATHLLKASSYNLRLVQKALGHRSITTTEVYADVVAPDMEKALKKLYKV
jgi:site-specific recombinase XerD